MATEELRLVTDTGDVERINAMHGRYVPLDDRQASRLVIETPQPVDDELCALMKGWSESLLESLHQRGVHVSRIEISA